MISPKSKRDREIYQYLFSNLSNKYDIHYKHFSIELEWYTLKIDFIIQLKEEFLIDKERPILYYIQNAQNASLKKMTQIYDLILSYSSVTVIWEDDDIKNKLNSIVNMLNRIINEKEIDNVISPNLKFLIFCDSNEDQELEKFKQEMYLFNSAITELERDHGIEPEEINEEDEGEIDETLN